jgi:CBS-domain-containing membrane protein
VCPGVVVVVDAEGRAENIASDEVGKGAIEVPVVRDVMTSPALTVEANDLLTQVVRRLDLHDVTSLPVVDAHGHLVGVVGEADVMRQLARNSTHNDERVRDVMTTAVWTASADEPLIRVAELFGRTSLKSLPVVLHDAVVGVISRRDLVRAAARHQLPATL